VGYGPGAESAAGNLADQLGLTATPSPDVPANTVRLTLGADFPTDYLSDDGNGDAAASTPSTTAQATRVATVAATATGSDAPAPTQLTHMTASGSPCVK